MKGSTLSTRRRTIGSQDLRASWGVRCSQPEDGTSLSCRGSLRAKASGHQQAGAVTTVTNQLSGCDGAGGECRPEVRRHDAWLRVQGVTGPLRVMSIMIQSRHWPLTAVRLAAQLGANLEVQEVSMRGTATARGCDWLDRGRQLTIAHLIQEARAHGQWEADSILAIALRHGVGQRLEPRLLPRPAEHNGGYVPLVLVGALVPSQSLRLAELYAADLALVPQRLALRRRLAPPNGAARRCFAGGSNFERCNTRHRSTPMNRPDSDLFGITPPPEC